MTTPSGWGNWVPVGQHYIRYYTTTDQLLEVVRQSVAAGLRSDELVLFSLEPALIVRQVELLEREFPDLDERIAAGQLVQRLCVQVVHTWKHGGAKGLRDLLAQVSSEARHKGFARVRWVGQMSLTMTDCSLEDWHRAKRALDRVLLAGADIPFVGFSVCRPEDFGEPRSLLSLVRREGGGVERQAADATEGLLLAAMQFMAAAQEFLAVARAQDPLPLSELRLLLACEAGLKPPCAVGHAGGDPETMRQMVESGLVSLSGTGPTWLTPRGRRTLASHLGKVQEWLFSHASPLSLWHCYGFSMQKLDELIGTLTEPADAHTRLTGRLRQGNWQLDAEELPGSDEIDRILEELLREWRKRTPH